MASSAAYQREWRAKNPGYAARKSREYYTRNPQVIRQQNLRRNYGLSVEQYEEMFAQQEGRCASCKLSSDERLYVDHDHGTNAVRALLCRGCNTALGHLREDPARIRALAVYIEAMRN